VLENTDVGPYAPRGMKHSIAGAALCAVVIGSLCTVARAQPSAGTASEAQVAPAPQPAPAAPAAPRCSPAAKACLRDCPAGEVSTRAGLCIPIALPAPTPSAAGSGGSAAWNGQAPPAWHGPRARAAAAAPEVDPTSVATFAVLVNPADIILTAALYGIATVPLNILVALLPYLALDLYAALMVADDVGGVFMLGPRITPQGRNLDGFYVAGRGGYAALNNQGGGAGSGQLGYTWFLGHFVVSVGAGVLYIGGDVGTIAPFIDLSLGAGL
jgi:hypothetical protein